MRTCRRCVLYLELLLLPLLWLLPPGSDPYTSQQITGVRRIGFPVC